MGNQSNDVEEKKKKIDEYSDRRTKVHTHQMLALFEGISFLYKNRLRKMVCVNDRRIAYQARRANEWTEEKNGSTKEKIIVNQLHDYKHGRVCVGVSVWCLCALGWLTPSPYLEQARYVLRAPYNAFAIRIRFPFVCINRRCAFLHERNQTEF